MFVSNGVAWCDLCILQCKMCLSATTCIVCNTPYSFQDGKCGCSQGTYLNSAATPNTCVSCTTPCVKCLSADYCELCDFPFQVQLRNCTCPPSFYLSGALCAVCPTGCETCQLIATKVTCVNCRPTFTGRVDASTKEFVCACCTNCFLLNSSICMPCGPLCSTCTSYGTCTACYDTSLTAPACACPAGSFRTLNIEKPYCDLCVTKCSSCTARTICTACTTGMNALVTDNCECALGKYLDSSSVCDNCPTRCTLCSTSEYCITCTDGAYVYGNLCVCYTGTYLNGTNCVSCDLTCKSCTTAASRCTACHPGFTLTSEGSCKCDSGKWSNVTLTILPRCLNCKPECLLCTTGTACTECINATYMYYSGGNCLCTGSTFLNKDSITVTCDSCAKSCVSCTGVQACTNCYSSFLLVSGLCYCPLGQYELVQASGPPICKICPGTCVACLTDLLCYSCTSNFILRALKCGCPPDQFLSGRHDRFTCNTCPTVCTACTTFLACTECRPGLTISAAGRCECSNGNFLRLINST
jgi:proprotein convertase subtilisin/kexin type 5